MRELLFFFLIGLVQTYTKTSQPDLRTRIAIVEASFVYRLRPPLSMIANMAMGSLFQIEGKASSFRAEAFATSVFPYHQNLPRAVQFPKQNATVLVVRKTVSYSDASIDGG